MPYRTCYYQRDFNGITLEKKHPCTGIGSRFSSCSALDNSTRFLMAIEVEKTRSFQQFRTLQGPLLAHQFGEVRMQRPNLVYPRHQAVQVLLAPRTPKRPAVCRLFWLCDVGMTFLRGCCPLTRANSPLTRSLRGLRSLSSRCKRALPAPRPPFRRPSRCKMPFPAPRTPFWIAFRCRTALPALRTPFRRPSRCKMPFPALRTPFWMAFRCRTALPAPQDRAISIVVHANKLPRRAQGECREPRRENARVVHRDRPGRAPAWVLA